MNNYRELNRPPPENGISQEAELIGRVRARDETTIRHLFKAYYQPMLRTARTCVRSVEEAEDVIQETWIAVLSGIDRFAARSSFRTWLFNIMFNVARTRARREARWIPFSQLGDDRELQTRRTADDPEAYAARGETRRLIEEAVATLPAMQQRVFILSEVDGLPPEEVCSTLELSAVNRRVLLHRGRISLRRQLSPQLREMIAT
jgi:RNA polymerase sigma-70 factor (ECF subfamily)